MNLYDPNIVFKKLFQPKQHCFPKPNQVVLLPKPNQASIQQRFVVSGNGHVVLEPLAINLFSCLGIRMCWAGIEPLTEY